ncbi:MAG TPA: 1-deoxy-D-xylulose-5-phosphate synthase N-terminal domain-containing protein [Dehalococcoidia bacterium]|nr:1-deoxy-D-xylulose-5-phosphate synthase N-terminal domain-containing protein [Dehalococcoidia bacterium]
MSAKRAVRKQEKDGDRQIAYLKELERKVLWLSTWMIHNANHIRPKRDGLKVGGHQASSASVVTLLTALYFRTLRPQDRVAVKPHASPVFHAIQYLMGRQSLDQLQGFRSLNGAQSYPSRTKDKDDVDFSTGSEGMGVASTLFASIIQDYLHMKGMLDDDQPVGRMVALVGDAELDEGNIYEAMLEGWKHEVRNVWWIVDYNRQSLDGIVADRLFNEVDSVFRATGWRVITLKYGKKLHAAFVRPGGAALHDWIDACPNSLYSALVYKGGASWREHLEKDIGDVLGVAALLDSYGDEALAELMTNLAGHDIEAVLEAFDEAAQSDEPTCFIAYTIKGYGLPLAGHKDNHSGLMDVEQIEPFRDAMSILPGQEWDMFAGLQSAPTELQAFIDAAPFAQSGSRRHRAPQIPLPPALPSIKVRSLSTQDAFGRILFDLAGSESELAAAVLTMSPDVTVSTNLIGWVNRVGVFRRRHEEDPFRGENVPSALRWTMGPSGRHIELGIAESNLFLSLGAAGLSGELFGRRLLPIGTLYDPFIIRGLDSLNYASYAGSRFMVVATPSGLTLAPEGGAHQSIVTPLIGLGQPGLTQFEPAFADELAVTMHWAFGHMQADDGGSVYLRLSTREVEQPERDMTPELRRSVIDGGYWLRQPQRGAGLAICYTGAVAPEAIEAWNQISEDVPGAGLLAITSANRLYSDWRQSWLNGTVGGSHIERLLGELGPDAMLVTIADGHPAVLSWLGSVMPSKTYSLGVTAFGQSGDIPDLYHKHGLDVEAILNACSEALADQTRKLLAIS